MIIDKNGFYTITDKEYHADPCPTPSFSSGMAQAIIEKTEIEAMLSSQRLNPNYRDKKSDVMDLGVIAEDFILKGEDNTFEIAPFDDWRTNAAKEARAQIEAKGLVALNNTTGERLLGDVREMKRRLFEQLGEHNDQQLAKEKVDAMSKVLNEIAVKRDKENHPKATDLFELAAALEV